MTPPDPQPSVPQPHGPIRVVVYVGWLAMGVVLLRYWDLTIRLEGFLLWTAVFIAAFSVATLILRKFNLLHREKPWVDVWGWLAILVVVNAAAVFFPVVTLPGSTVQTVAFLRVFDVVLPLWIFHKGVYAAWSPDRLRLGATLAVPIYLLVVLWFVSLRVPGSTYEGPLPDLTVEELEIAQNSERLVRMLADSIGARGSRQPEAVAAAVDYLTTEFEGQGWSVTASSYPVGEVEHVNLEVELYGATSPEEIVVVGAHYDTYDLTPGADDNATGVAGVLELARLMRSSRPQRTIRFVLFGTEEPPYFNTDNMGSRWYASRARDAGEQIVAMYSLEMLGYFRDEAGTQRYPPPMHLFFPERGDFIGFIGNPGSGRLLRRSLGTFRETTDFPSEGIVSSSAVPGVELSDHASFWRVGFPAVAISDTGPFRNENYHTAADNADSIDYERMARVVAGVRRVVEEIAGAS